MSVRKPNLTKTQRGILESTLQNMEAGSFQELMLQLLPAMNPKYVGITRFGGTSFGKTTTGVPDLLKVLATGEMIACECSTEEDYWVPPKDTAHIEKWKPISDAIKCLDSLQNPIEIVLASNQELSKKHPRAKAQVIAVLKPRTQAAITPLSCEDLGVWFQTHCASARGAELIRQFFPEIHENIGAWRRREVAEETLRQSSLAGFPVDTIERIVNHHLGRDEKEIAELVAAQIGYSSDRFTYMQPATAGVSRRDSIPDVMRCPVGKIIQLNGVPKIGKSWLTAQAIEISAIPSRWYLCPTEDNLLADFLNAFLVDLFSEFWPRAEVTRAKRENRLFHLSLHQGHAQITGQLFVIENAHLLRKTHLDSLSQALRWLKSTGFFKHVGCVLLTNRTVAHQFPVLDDSCIAPPWTRDQLLALLDQHSVKVPERDKYVELLRQLSGGHPLHALALARKYPTGPGLVQSLTQPPNLEESDLSAEIKGVLFQDILTTPDKQNFIHRLSLLLHRANGKVLEALRVKVQPPIATPLRILFDEIGGAVLDGDTKTGLAVSPTFKKVAAAGVSREEAMSVYRILATELARPDGNALRADDFIDSILYSVFAGDMLRAFTGASFIISTLSRQSEEPSVTRALLSRLEFLNWVTVSEDPEIRLFHYAYLTTAAHRALNTGDESQASNLLQVIDLRWLQGHRFADRDHAEMAKALTIGALGGRTLLLANESEPNAILEQFFALIEDPATPAGMKMLPEVIPLVVTRLEAARLRTLHWNTLVVNLSRTDPALVGNLALFIGNLLHEKQNLEDIIESESDGSNLLNFYWSLTLASRDFHSGDHVQAERHLAKAQSVAPSLSFPQEQFGAGYFQFVGDLNFELGQRVRAVESYDRSSALVRDRDQYIIAWNELRIGILTEDDPDTSLKHLERARLLFEKESSWRWLGVTIAISAVVLLKAKHYSKAILTIEELTFIVHRDGRNEAGPSLRLVIAQIMRLIAEITKTALPQPISNFPDLESRIHLRNLNPTHKPETGGPATFNVLARLAQAVNLREVALSLIRASFTFPSSSRADNAALWFNFHLLLSLLDAAEFDWNELESILKVVLKSQPDDLDEFEDGFFSFLFRPLRTKAEQAPEEWTVVFLTYLDLVERIKNTLPSKNASQWDGWISHSRGIASLRLGQRRLAARHFIQSLANCDQITHSIKLEAAEKLAFELYSTADSMIELARRQYAAFKILVSETHSEEQRQHFGVNLFRMCSSLVWKRVSVADMRVKEHLYDSAKELKTAGMSENDAASVMIVLLLCAFNDIETPRPSIQMERLPDSVRETCERGRRSP